MEKSVNDARYKAVATLSDGDREWDVTIYSQSESEEAAKAGLVRFASHGYNIVKSRIERKGK